MYLLVTVCAAALSSAIADPVNIFRTDITPEEAQTYLNSPPFTEPELSSRTAVLPLVRWNDPSFRTAEAGPTLGHYWKNGKEIENTDDYLEEVYKASQFHGQDGLGAYTYGYKAPESSKVENRVRSGDVTGSYIYKAGSNNDLIKVRYWADSQGFHQEDNLPKFQPKPVEETAAVKAARIAHEKAWKEAADATLHPYAFQQQQQQQVQQLQQQAKQLQNQQYQGNFGQQYNGQQQQFPAQHYNQPSGQQYGQQSGQQYGQQPSFGQQYQGQQGAASNQYQQGGNNGQYQASASTQHSQYSQGNLQASASTQNNQFAASENQGNLQAAASIQQNQYSKPLSLDAQQSVSDQQYKSVPPQLNGQQQYQQQQYSSQQQYGQQDSEQENQHDDGQYHEKYQEETGPPRGFFYSFDYPVSIITAKSDLEGGAINPGHPVDHDTVAVGGQHQ